MTECDSALLQRIHAGEFVVDSDGGIWRVQDHLGKTVAPRRAEKLTTFGYLQVRRMIDGRRFNALAHRLVWLASGRPIPDGMVINHKNGVKDDNRPANLEVVTPAENMSHAHRHRLLDQRGEANPACKLTDDEVAEIRRRRASGERLHSIAGDFGVAFQTVSKLARGARRETAPGPTDDADGRLNCWKDMERRDDGTFAGRLLDGRTHDDRPGGTP